MSKSRSADPDIAPEYDFSPGRRGVYLERAKGGIRPVIPVEPAQPFDSKRAAPPDADVTLDAGAVPRRAR